jgi:DNA-binding NtrC family response regulator
MEVKEEKKSVVIVDDDASLRRSTEYLLKREGWKVFIAEDAAAGLSMLGEQHCSVMLLDLRMPGMNGLELIDRALALQPELAIVMMTAHGSIETAVDAMRRGAFDFMTKPFEKGQLLAVVEKACRYHSLLHENHSLRRLVSSQYNVENIIGVSEAMSKVLQRIHLISSTPSNILLLGESGTGKELLAKTIHMNSRVSSGPFVAVNVAGIPLGVFESEFFGHKKGSFTGALESRRGSLGSAAGGTLFLDEVGELPKEIQVKLLRVLQEREYSRLGEDRLRKLEARVIAATNLDLEQAVEAGDFREDLYYRLCVVPIKIPPLRERREDIPALTAYFLERAALRLERPVPRLSRRALEGLCHYDFPGNVRELENLMERVVALSTGERIEVADLALVDKRKNLASLLFEYQAGGVDLQKLEKDLLVEALSRSAANQTRAAKLLGITRSALIYRADKYGLKGSSADQG